MTPSVGVVVLVGGSALLARTVRSVHRTGTSAVTFVVPPTCDTRTLAWLEALAGTSGWDVVHAQNPSAGACWNLGIRQTPADWLALLDSGDRLSDAFGHVAPGLAVSPDIAVAVGAARLTALGVDEIVRPTDSPGIVDPADPLLRATCWRRDAVLAVGGCDEQLPAALRYDLWLQLSGAGYASAVIADLVVEIGVAAGDPCYEELGAAAYASAVAAIHARRAAQLRPVTAALLERREHRLAALKARHFACLARRAVAVGGRHAPDRVDDPLPVDIDADGRTLPRRVTPRSRDWGYERGGPIDRIYIEEFIARHAVDIRGAVLEVQEADYTGRYGGPAVTRSDVVDVDEGNRGATIIADLRAAPHIADDTYDCIILTQTLHVIDDMAAVLAECWRVLRPGGVLLATLPCASRVCLEYGPMGDYWRVTPAGARQLLQDRFGLNVQVVVFGNALATSAFALGLGRLEVDAGDLEFADPYNPTLVGVRATKEAETASAAAVSRTIRSHGVVLLYHRVGGLGPDPHRLNLEQDVFTGQMGWLAAHCAVLPLDELVAGAATRSLPARAVAVTFDDGYRDTLLNAGPVLAHHGMPATCFVATEGLDDEQTFWWDQLAAMFLAGDERPSVLTVELGSSQRHLRTATRGERLFAHQLVYAEAVAMTPEARRRLLSRLEDWSGTPVLDPACRRMTAPELRRLAQQGITLGAHTVTHPRLSDLALEAQYRELAESKAVLERIAGTTVSAVAYPFGSYNESTIEAARKAGFCRAVTCEPRACSAEDRPLAIPRIDTQEPVLERFAARVTHLLNALPS